MRRNRDIGPYLLLGAVTFLLVICLVRLVQIDESHEDMRTILSEMNNDIEGLRRRQDNTSVTLQVDPVVIDPVNIYIKEDNTRISYTETEYEELMMLVMHEAGGESYECQLWTASAIINRVLLDEYPATLHGVIYDDKHGIQFSPTIDGLYMKPTESVVKAVYEALRVDYAEGCYIFNNPKLTEEVAQKWFDKKELVRTIDDVDFRR